MNIENLELTANIVCAYVSHNSLPVAQLPDLIASISGSLLALGSLADNLAEQVEVKSEPAVSIKKSITPDYLICLEDGKKFKSLKRHLISSYEMTPEQYRAKWKLPADYPMVAPAYAASRSALAKSLGLGRKPGAKAANRKNAA